MVYQVITLVANGLKSTLTRLSGVFVAIFCVASVVFLFISVLSMLAGFSKTMSRTGQEDVAVIMRSGALSEVNSVLNVSDLPAMLAHPEIASEGDTKLASGQFYLVVELAKKNGQAVNVPMRGIEHEETALHPDFVLSAGRMFTRGTTEIVVGTAASGQFAGLELGNTVNIQGANWTVVGLFDDGGNVYESEIWADLQTMQAVFQHQDTLQSLRVKLTSPVVFDSYKAAIQGDPRFDLQVERETDYFSSHGSGLITLVQKTVDPLAMLMMVGAIFAALNATYASISTRMTEIATLRALGFTDGAMSLAVLLEAILVSLIGGLIGIGVSYLIVDGFLFSTMNGEAFSQLVFRFNVTPIIVAQGIAMALAIGLLSGLLPAWLAIRTPLHIALRKA